MNRLVNTVGKLLHRLACNGCEPPDWRVPMCDLEHFGRQMITIIFAKLDIPPLYQNNKHPKNFRSRAAQQLADLNLSQAVIC